MLSSRILNFNRYSKSLLALLSIFFLFLIPLCSWLILKSTPEFSSTLCHYLKATFFSEPANTNRYDINWSTADDFLYNIELGNRWHSIIGFNFNEAYCEAQYFFFIMEGIFSLFLVYRCAHWPFRLLMPTQKILYVLIFYPLTGFIALVLYPFGIFNLAAQFAINNPLPHFFISIPLFLSSAIIMQKENCITPEMCNNYLFVLQWCTGWSGDPVILVNFLSCLHSSR